MHTNKKNDFEIRLEPKLSSPEFVDVLERSTLAERRPVDDASIVAGMLEHADLVATARTSGGLLIGVARPAVCQDLWDFSARVLANQSVRQHESV